MVKQEIAVEELYADFVITYKETLEYLKIPDNGSLDNIDQVFNILSEKNLKAADFFKDSVVYLIMRRFYYHLLEDSSIINNSITLYDELAQLIDDNLDGSKSLSISLFDRKLEADRKIKQLLDEAMNYYLCEFKDGKLHHNGINEDVKADNYFVFLVKTRDVFRVPDNIQRRYQTIEYNYDPYEWNHKLFEYKLEVESKLLDRYGLNYIELIEDYDHLLDITRKLKNGYKIYQKLLENEDGMAIMDAVNNGMKIK
jgi:hypothetical protein